MLKDKNQDHDPSTIDGIIRSLTNRPGVQATLILSRRDGSIIRATGYLDSRSGPRITPGNNPDNVLPHSAEHDESSIPVKPASPDSTRHVPSQAELMAASVHNFVQSSADLAGKISLLDSMKDFYNNKSTDDTAQLQDVQKDTSLNGSAGDDVQLLRLRTKKQEIIIFPDPNYLCCVVQAIGKGTI